MKQKKTLNFINHYYFKFILILALIIAVLIGLRNILVSYLDDIARPRITQNIARDELKAILGREFLEYIFSSKFNGSIESVYKKMRRIPGEDTYFHFDIIRLSKNPKFVIYSATPKIKNVRSYTAILLMLNSEKEQGIVGICETIQPSYTPPKIEISNSEILTVSSISCSSDSDFLQGTPYYKKRVLAD